MIRSTVHAAGLPARSSMRREPVASAPDGDSLPASECMPWKMGTTRRSFEPSSVLTTCAGRPCRRPSVSDLATPGRPTRARHRGEHQADDGEGDEPGADVEDGHVTPRSSRRGASRSMPTNSITMPPMPMKSPIGVGPQQADVLVVDEHHVEEQADRQRDEDVGREAAFGRQRAHLALERLTLAQRRSPSSVSVSARLPPTSRWIRIAMTVHRIDVLPIRIAIRSRASVMSVPMRVSASARENSFAAGSAVSEPPPRAPGAGRSRSQAGRDEKEDVGEQSLERIRRRGWPWTRRKIGGRREPDEGAEHERDEGRTSASSSTAHRARPSDDAIDLDDEPLARPERQVSSLDERHRALGRLAVLHHRPPMAMSCSVAGA